MPMPKIHFTHHLRRFFDGLQDVDVRASTVADALSALEERFPGLRGYLVDEHGNLRRHVNVFVNDRQVTDRNQLSDAVDERTELFIMQALSGG